MQDYPLLDLASAWQDAHRMLKEVIGRAEHLYYDSKSTWDDMVSVHRQALDALIILGDLPPAVLEGIAKDRADLEEWEAKAEAQGY